MEKIARTIHGARLQSAQFAGLPFSTQQYTTLNEKFNINADVEPQSGVYPRAQYYCIGNGGHGVVIGTNGIPLNKTKQHKATDAALFSHLPFVLRPANDDIDNETQQKYALRKPVTIESVNYFAYYLKRLPVDEVTISSTIQTVVDGVITSAAHVPSIDDLSPTPVEIEGEGANELAGQYANVTAPLPFVLTTEEVNEIVNAAEIIYGDPAYAIISEIGLVSGVDYDFQLPNTDHMLEVIAAQITSFVAARHELQFATGVSGHINVGANEPLLLVHPQ